MNKIKQIVQMNVNVQLQNMNVIIDSFCDDVRDDEAISFVPVSNDQKAQYRGYYLNS
jgi:hypothetical protein